MSKFISIVVFALTSTVASCGGAYAQPVYGSVGVDSKVVVSGVTVSNQPSVYGMVGVKDSLGFFGDVTARTLSTTQVSPVVNPTFSLATRVGYETAIGDVRLTATIARNTYLGVAGTPVVPSSLNDTWVAVKAVYNSADASVAYHANDNQVIANKDTVYNVGYTITSVPQLTVRGGLSAVHYAVASTVLYNGVDIQATYSLTDKASVYALGRLGGRTFADTNTFGVNTNVERVAASNLVVGAKYSF
jgi:hypothetical protein